jgi:D-sedoheptulose 7-phosphate isomerase
MDPLVQEHRAATVSALDLAGPALERAAQWGRRLAEIVTTGGRLLVCGDSGSPEARHLGTDIVARVLGAGGAVSARALHPAIPTTDANDYEHVQAYARQVAALTGSGDVMLLLSPGGRSPDLLEATDRAVRLGARTWALTGPVPNPLAHRCDEAAAVPSVSVDAIQEVHLVAVHVLCDAFDAALPSMSGRVL